MPMFWGGAVCAPDNFCMYKSKVPPSPSVEAAFKHVVQVRVLLTTWTILHQICATLMGIVSRREWTHFQKSYKRLWIYHFIKYLFFG